MVGVGITPPKVLGTPKPASSVMISSTLGAPFGGTTRGAHQGLDCSASFLITPPNFGSGAGNCLLLMVVVALGEPGTPVICWAMDGTAASRTAAMNDRVVPRKGFFFMLILLVTFYWHSRCRDRKEYPVYSFFGFAAKAAFSSSWIRASAAAAPAW